MAITTMDGVVAGLDTAPTVNVVMQSVTNVAGGFVSLNTAAVHTFGQLSTPTANTSGGQKYNNHTTPLTGFPAWTAASGGQTTYIVRATSDSGTAGGYYIYDLLWACSGFSGTVTSAQTVTTFAGMPSRNSSGTNTELWLWCFTALGSTNRNITVSYTNQAGTSSRTSISTAIGASLPATRMVQLPLQSGDTGVQNIASCTLSGTTGTAGNFGLAIMQRIACLPVQIANVPVVSDIGDLGFPSMSDEASLLFVNHSTAATTGLAVISMTLAQG